MAMASVLIGADNESVIERLKIRYAKVLSKVPATRQPERYYKDLCTKRKVQYIPPNMWCPFYISWMDSKEDEIIERQEFGYY